MNVELIGGPVDGHVFHVPVALPERIYVDGLTGAGEVAMAIYVGPGDYPKPCYERIGASTYRFCGWRQNEHSDSTKIG